MSSVLKVAAGTLDASTKIYAVRVDAVHADAYRVLGGLGAETKPGEGGSLVHCHNYLHLFLVFERTSSWCAAHGPGEDEEAAGAEVVAKQPKRKRPPKKTVEQNLSNINSAESERRGEVMRTEGHHPYPTSGRGSGLFPVCTRPSVVSLSRDKPASGEDVVSSCVVFRPPPHTGGSHVPAYGLVLR